VLVNSIAFREGDACREEEENASGEPSLRLQKARSPRHPVADAAGEKRDGHVHNRA